MSRSGIDSPGFEAACETLEGLTRMTRLETRGTLRITLREVGLDASTAGPEDIAGVALTALLPELRARGVKHARRVCLALARHLVGGRSAEPPPEGQQTADASS